MTRIENIRRHIQTLRAELHQSVCESFYIDKNVWNKMFDAESPMRYTQLRPMSSLDRKHKPAPTTAELTAEQRRQQPVRFHRETHEITFQTDERMEALTKLRESYELMAEHELSPFGMVSLDENDPKVIYEPVVEINEEFLYANLVAACDSLHQTK